MYKALEAINARPDPYQYYTAEELWTDEHTSKQMLSFHLNSEIDVSSRNEAFIDRSVQWIATHFHVGSGMKIADFGCGPGLYTTRLAQREAEVTGIDFSKRSIQYTRETASGMNRCPSILVPGIATKQNLPFTSRESSVIPLISVSCAETSSLSSNSAGKSMLIFIFEALFVLFDSKM